MAVGVIIPESDPNQALGTAPEGERAVDVSESDIMCAAMIASAATSDCDCCRRCGGGGGGGGCEAEAEAEASVAGADIDPLREPAAEAEADADPDADAEEASAAVAEPAVGALTAAEADTEEPLAAAVAVPA